MYSCKQDFINKIEELEKWIELYKALAEGRTIQHAVTSIDDWQDVNCINTEFIASSYRIKPNEPKVKLYNLSEIPKQVCFSTKGMSGSYYIELEGGHHCYDKDGNYQESFSVIPKNGRMWYLSDKKGLPLSEEPEFKVGDWVRVTLVHNKSHSFIVKYSNIWDQPECYIKEHWKPQEGDLFWGPWELMPEYMYKTRVELLQLKNIHNDGTYSLISPLDKNVYSYYIDPSEIKGFLAHCEPFIGDLPQSLQH